MTKDQNNIFLTLDIMLSFLTFPSSSFKAFHHLIVTMSSGELSQPQLRKNQYWV